MHNVIIKIYILETGVIKMNLPTSSELTIATPIVPTLANRANAIMQVHIRVHSNEIMHTMLERDGIALLCI